MRSFTLPILCVGLLCGLHRALGCPVGCECFAVTRTVKCVFTDLRAVPTDIPGYARTVIITGNNILRIGPDSFKELENVTNMILSSNRITEVASHSFFALSNLRYLDLSCNQLALIHPEALSIPGSPLQELNFSRSLYNSTSLTDLATALRWGRLGGLLRLDLSGNRLVHLPPGMFSHLPSLQHLLLPNNSLVAVHNGSFSGMPQLEVLDLSHNTLRTFRTSALRELGRLGRHARVLLSHNPFACSCEILDFVVWLNSSGAPAVGDVETLRCASPQEFQGTRLRELGVQAIGCHSPVQGEVADLSLQTSYVFLGLVLGFVGMIFLFVLYLNRGGIKKWIVDIRDACRDVLEGYHYRYEIDSDPRRGHLSADGRLGKVPGKVPGNARFGQAHPEKRLAQLPSDTCLVQIPSDTQVPAALSHAWPRHRASPAVPPPQAAQRQQLPGRRVPAEPHRLPRQHRQPGLQQGPPCGGARPRPPPRRPPPPPRRPARPPRPPPPAGQRRPRLGDHRLHPGLGGLATGPARLRFLRLHGLERLQGAALLRPDLRLLRQPGALRPRQRELHRPRRQGGRRAPPPAQRPGRVQPHLRRRPGAQTLQTLQAARQRQLPLPGRAHRGPDGGVPVWPRLRRAQALAPRRAAPPRRAAANQQHQPVLPRGPGPGRPQRRRHRHRLPDHQEAPGAVRAAPDRPAGQVHLRLLVLAQDQRDQRADLQHRPGLQPGGAGGGVQAGARRHTHQHAQGQEQEQERPGGAATAAAAVRAAAAAGQRAQRGNPAGQRQRDHAHPHLHQQRYGAGGEGVGANAVRRTRQEDEALQQENVLIWLRRDLLTLPTRHRDRLLRSSVAVRPLNKTARGSLLNKTVRGSLLNKTVRGSLLNKTARGSLLNKTLRGSLLNKTVRGSLLNKTVRGSLLHKTVRGSLLYKTARGSLLYKTARGSLLYVFKGLDLRTEGRKSAQKTLPG